VYEILPIPSTRYARWGVYFVFHHLDLPPRLEALFEKQREAVSYCQELVESIPLNVHHRYMWRWIAVDDDINQWWKNNPTYGREVRMTPYREGGRAIIIDYDE